MCSFCLQQILTKPEVDRGFRNSLVFYALNSYRVFWCWFPQEQIWESCCSWQDGPTWGGYNWDPKWELHLLLYLLLLWGPRWPDKDSLAPLRLKWHQLPGCGHHISHTSFPFHSEDNSLDSTPRLKPEGCPVPQRQWWDVMGSQCSGSLQYPPGLCSDFEWLPPLNAYSKMICRFLWKCSGEEN